MNFPQSPCYFGRLQAGLWQGWWRSLTEFTQHIQELTGDPRLASFRLLSLKIAWSFQKAVMSYYHRYLDAKFQMAFWLLTKVDLILWKWKWKLNSRLWKYWRSLHEELMYRGKRILIYWELGKDTVSKTCDGFFCLLMYSKARHIHIFTGNSRKSELQGSQAKLGWNCCLNGLVLLEWIKVLP